MVALVKLLLIGASAYGAAVATNYFSRKGVALDRALELVGDRGIINIGSGCSRSALAGYICNLESVRVNVDISNGSAKMLCVDLELGSLPFEDKEFDVAYASHVLEHLKNWQGALDEWCRIADYVIVVLPHPLSIGGRLNPDHWQHFSFRDMDYIRLHWPTVELFA